MKKILLLIAAVMISAVSFAEDVLVTKVTYTDGPFPYYPMGCEPPVVDGSIHFVPTGGWSQFFIGTGISLEAGDYKAVLRVKSTKAGSCTLTSQNGWETDSQSLSSKVNVTTDWADVTVKFNDIKGGNYDFIFKPETFDGTIDINYLEVYKVVADATPTKDVKVTEVTYTDGPFPYYPMGCEPPVVDGSIHFVPTGDWSQFFFGTGIALEAGNYKAVVTIKSTKAGSCTLTAQNGWDTDAQQMDGTVNMTTEMSDVTVKLDEIVGGNYDFILKPGTFDGTIDVNKLTIYKVVKVDPTSINKVKSENVKATKFIENGQIVIAKNGMKFNAAGQQMK